MKIKSIYRKNEVLVHEYFVNESDKNEIIAKMKLGDNVSDKLDYLLSNNDCILVETHNSCKLMIGDVFFTKDCLITNDSTKNNTNEIFEEVKSEEKIMPTTIEYGSYTSRKKSYKK